MRPRSSSLALAGLLAAALVAPLAAPTVAVAETRDGPGYVLEVSTPPSCRPGAASTATLTLRPRGAWHLNTDYPFKVELAPGAGVRVAKPVLRKDDARRFGESGADVDVVFTADKAGRGDITATVKFATCDDASCAVHKETVTISAPMP